MFEQDEVIFSYSRKQALEDGLLVDAAEVGKQAGFKVPLALTRAVWDHCVAWSGDGSQDEQGRLWDVCWMAAGAARRAAQRQVADRVWFEVCVVANGHHRATKTVLTLHLGPGDEGEPVGTVMFPSED